MKHTSRGVLVGVAVSAMLFSFGGAASADDSPPPKINSTKTPDNHALDLNAHHNTVVHHAPTPTGSTGTGSTPTGSTGTGSAPSPYPPPGPYGSYDDAFPKNPNADLSWMPGAVDACGSNWGGDGWNAPYAEATPCAPGEDPAPVAPQITAEMVTAAARLVAPRTPPHVQPGAVSYVNVPNNYWADAPTVNTTITLLGVVIPLRWTPVGVSWDFGDGSTATGNGIAGAEVGAAGAVEHGYLRQGSYVITTATAYDLTFVIPGQGAQTVQLTSPPSPAVTLPVREIQTRTSYTN